MSNEIKIAIMSDLHLEFDGRRIDSGPDLSGLKGNVDLVLLAGDIDVGDRAMNYAARLHGELGCEVVLIAGNHEFYHDNRLRVMSELRVAAASSPVHYLDNETIELEIGSRRIRVLGCTLWTDYDLYGDATAAMIASLNVLNDHRIIYEGSRGNFAPKHALKLHQESRAWLEKELARPFDGTTIVMTHHCPSGRSVDERFKGDPVSAAFSSNLDGLVDGSGAVIWVHGHAHDSYDYMIGETRVICNPRGYYGDELNPGFLPDLVVEV